MLQQTQASRVAEKFLDFIKKFPDFQALANAPLDSILRSWQGLGYNRRAIALKKIAQIIINDYQGELPDSKEILESFPQIGKATASSIISFAFNKPTIFIETNIRRVYIYFFFFNDNKVDDKEILQIIEKTIDRDNSRKWYYALMDYGVMLKKKHPDLHKKSAHYQKQAPFKGSNRELRGKILDFLIIKKNITKSEIERNFKNINSQKIMEIIYQLEKEGFINVNDNNIEIAE
jgi:A/G-specific adenine glycosylase